MLSTKYEQAYEYAAHVLRQELLPVFLYHNANHTLNEVVPACEKLAEMEGVGEPACWLLRTAACFHDLGLTAVKSLDREAISAVRAIHEVKSAEIARSVLPGFGFSPGEIDAVCSLILATRWGYVPQNLLEQIIRDADMSSIGAELAYYQQTSEALRREFSIFSAPMSEIDWLKRQVKTLSSYTFQTQTARKLYDANRLKNIKANQVRIEQLRAGAENEIVA